MSSNECVALALPRSMTPEWGKRSSCQDQSPPPSALPPLNWSAQLLVRQLRWRKSVNTTDTLQRHASCFLFVVVESKDLRIRKWKRLRKLLIENIWIFDFNSTNKIYKFCFHAVVLISIACLNLPKYMFFRYFTEIVKLLLFTSSPDRRSKALEKAPLPSHIAVVIIVVLWERDAVTAVGGPRAEQRRLTSGGDRGDWYSRDDLFVIICFLAGVARAWMRSRERTE